MLCDQLRVVRDPVSMLATKSSNSDGIRTIDYRFQAHLISLLTPWLPDRFFSAENDRRGFGYSGSYRLNRERPTGAARTCPPAAPNRPGAPPPPLRLPLILNGYKHDDLSVGILGCRAFHRRRARRPPRQRTKAVVAPPWQERTTVVARQY
jgi:hypothetical protein